MRSCVVVNLYGLRWRERDAGALVHFILHELHALLGNDVFEARVLAIGAIAEVAMNRQHGFRHVHEFVRREKADDVGEARVRGFVAVTASHAATDGEVVADELVVLHHGDEAEAVREQVHVVHGRNGERNFEFARQICLAVKRVNEVLVLGGFVIELHAIDPDGVIRLGLRREGQGDFVAVGKDLFARFRVRGRGRGHDIAVHVAARRERREQRLVDLRHQRTQTGLHDAVKLDALPRGDAQRVVAVLRREFVEHAPLVRRHHAARECARGSS